MVPGSGHDRRRTQLLNDNGDERCKEENMNCSLTKLSVLAIALSVSMAASVGYSHAEGKGKGKDKQTVENKGKHGRQAGALPFGLQRQSDSKGELPSGLQKKKNERGSLTRGLEQGGKRLKSEPKAD
jgi:hypothetical protein